ncbi:MAG: MBL fold metallo-hydrolase [Gammaproteobacteria bacterium]|nr:MBL fold metallo-hydrolase [Gammaproteobacteria bacterium]
MGIRQLTAFSFLTLVLVSCGGQKASAPSRAVAEAVGPNTYVIFGPNQLPNPVNKGFMNNPGFVVTNKGVVVIDPGSGLKIGKMVVDEIRRVTTQPVVAVINTHIHGDHWLGNGGIIEAFPEAVIYGHPDMMERANHGAGEDWIKLINGLTDGAIVGTKPVLPSKTLNDGDVLTFGMSRLKIHHTGHAHTHGDLMVELVTEKVFFLGDIVLHGRIGRMDDGNFKGNIDAIDRALAANANVYVPGHGMKGDKSIPMAYRTYLSTIYETVKGLYDQGLTDFDMKPQVVENLVEFQDWGSFETEVGRQVSLCYIQVEQAAF